MFKIQFSPVSGSPRLDFTVSGDVLTVDGEAFDFSAVPEGATLPRAAVSCAWLNSDVERKGGVIELTVLLPHGPAAPPETRFPEPVEVSDGAVPLPPYGAAEALPVPQDPEEEQAQ